MRGISILNFTTGLANLGFVVYLVAAGVNGPWTALNAFAGIVGISVGALAWSKS